MIHAGSHVIPDSLTVALVIALAFALMLAAREYRRRREVEAQRDEARATYGPPTAQHHDEAVESVRERVERVREADAEADYENARQVFEPDFAQRVANKAQPDGAETGYPESFADRGRV